MDSGINYLNFIKAMDKQRADNNVFDWKPDYSYLTEAMLENRGLAASGHMGDIGKLPNHPTFSDESAFSGKKVTGGHWANDGSSYTPSLDMVMGRNGASTKGLAGYMRIVEPNTKLKRTIPVSKVFFNEQIK